MAVSAGRADSCTQECDLLGTVAGRLALAAGLGSCKTSIGAEVHYKTQSGVRAEHACINGITDSSTG